MRSRKKENSKYLNNCLSFGILIVFIICEFLYFNIYFESDFKNKIDNFPNDVKVFVSEKISNVLLKKNMQLDKDINNDDYKELIETINNDLVITSQYVDADDSKLEIEQTEQNVNVLKDDVNILLNDYNDVKNTDINTDISVDTSVDIDTDIDTNIGPYKDIINIESSIKDKRLIYETVDTTYFNNALFIGDSRMAGFEIYKKLPGASYFCYSSASVFNIFEKENNVETFGNIKLLDLLSTHKFDKIYIMLGINSLQTDYLNHKAKYKEMIDIISTLQPNAIIYIIANFHVTDVEDVAKPYLTNKNIDEVNDFIKGFADNAQIFYLDSNPMYDDENGNLKLELSTDNIHIHIKHYDKFLVYLLSNALVEDNTIRSNVIEPKK